MTRILRPHTNDKTLVRPDRWASLMHSDVPKSFTPSTEAARLQCSHISENTLVGISQRRYDKLNDLVSPTDSQEYFTLIYISPSPVERLTGYRLAQAATVYPSTTRHFKTPSKRFLLSIDTPRWQVDEWFYTARSRTAMR